MDLEALPDSIHQLVNDELAPGERVRWACQPRPRASLPWWSLAPFFVAVPWTLFTLFWMAGAAGLLDRGPGPIDITRLLLALFGVPFLLIGIAMFCSPLWVRHQRRRAASRTAYAITDRRAIVFDGGYYGCERILSRRIRDGIWSGRISRIRIWISCIRCSSRRIGCACTITRGSGAGIASPIIAGSVTTVSATAAVSLRI